MKNNYLYKIEKRPFSILLNSKRPVCLIGLMLGLFTCQETQAQFVNQSDVMVGNGTIMTINMDYKNAAAGKFTNDGQVQVLGNWTNDGVVSYSKGSSGTTFFSGIAEQNIEGSAISDFQNIVFNNLASVIPFQLKSVIAVGNNSNFMNGIINAGQYNGKMIFRENANFSNVGNQSFVDGLVEKIGDASFEFPVGNNLFFRPSYHANGSSIENDYTTQYFNQDSNSLHSHASKDESILSISDAEYWKVEQIGGTQNIVLSLTLDKETTPSSFISFTENTETEIAIVRWDDRQSKWVNDGGDVSEAMATENYSKLLTSEVKGYGIFTMAIVKKTPKPEDGLEVFNALSPNGDGINDTFHIKGIVNYPDNTVEIYNRWGVKVFDAKSYNESDNVFAGYSDGRVTVKRGEKLPTGTYFYIIKYKDGEKGVQKSGYLYINNN